MTPERILVVWVAGLLGMLWGAVGTLLLLRRAAFELTEENRLLRLRAHLPSESTTIPRTRIPMTPSRQSPHFHQRLLWGCVLLSLAGVLPLLPLWQGGMKLGVALPLALAGLVLLRSSGRAL